MATNVNSTANSNSSSSTVKSDNGYCIISSMENGSADTYIQTYQSLSFDASPSIKRTRNAEVTSYAVESGQDVSDHIQIKNDKFSVEAYITETPLELRGDEISAAGVNGGRIKAAIDYLDQVFENRQTITFITRDHIYDSVVLTGIDYSYTDEDCMKFSLSFEKVRLVTSATVDGIATKTKSTTNKGKTVKTKANTTSVKKDSTVTNISNSYQS